MKDALGDRMKGYYEDRTRIKLMRRTYTFIRIDGNAFHTYTKGLTRPFDEGLISDMNETMIYLCSKIMGCKMGYVQSDEITLLLTDFDDRQTQAWFDNNLQKLCSISASMATSKFNQLRMMRACLTAGGLLDHDELRRIKLAEFDSRVWQVPTKTEVINTFIWRQQDAVRNSIQSAAQSVYKNHNDLDGKKQGDMQEMLFQKGINWNDYSFGEKRGRVCIKTTDLYVREKNTKQKGKHYKELYPTASDGDIIYGIHHLDSFSHLEYYMRSKWEVVETPTFKIDHEIFNVIPLNQ